MANKNKHHKQYLENKELLKILSDTKHYDWQVTIMFYCSLHLVEGYIAEKLNTHDMKHFQRNNYVVADSFLKSISSEYLTLHSESVRARYLCEKITEKDVGFAKELLEVIENKLLNSVNAI